MIQKAEIHLTDHGLGKVYIDGREVGDVTEVAFSAGVVKERWADVVVSLNDVKCMDFFEWRRFGWPK